MIEKKVWKLSAIAGGLFILALIVNINEHKRRSHLGEGSDFLVGLDIEKVNKIQLTDKKNNDFILLRDGKKFVLKNLYEFPADNEKINSLIYKLANITIKEKITDNKANYSNYKVDESDFETHVKLFDSKDNEITNFYLGKTGKPKGNYIRNGNKSEVYLTEDNVLLPVKKDSFVNKEVLKFDQNKLAKVQVKTEKESIEIIKENDSFKLVGNKNTNVDEKKIKEYVRGMNDLFFDDFYPRNDRTVVGLNFDKILEIDLDEHISYLLKSAVKDKKHYFSLSMNLRNVPEQVQISRNDNKEKLKTVDGFFKVSNMAKKFNERHGPWIYSMSQYKFEKLFDFTKNILNKK